MLAGIFSTSLSGLCRGTLVYLLYCSRLFEPSETLVHCFLMIGQDRAAQLPQNGTIGVVFISMLPVLFRCQMLQVASRFSECHSSEGLARKCS